MGWLHELLATSPALTSAVELPPAICYLSATPRFRMERLDRIVHIDIDINKFKYIHIYVDICVDLLISISIYQYEQ